MDKSHHANWYVLHPSFFSKKVETSLSRMRLFGYIVVFADDVRDDERLFGIPHVRDGEEEVSNAKCMRIVEEEVPIP
jgi:hypothetical protein